MKIVVQINGKYKTEIEVGSETKQEIEDLAIKSSGVENELVDKVVYVPGRLTNIITKASMYLA
jgi:leucyl-tRNA synthetase